MELKEGMHVRTKDGFIDEVIIEYNGCCNNPNCNCKHVSCKYNYYDENIIIKASYKIIDLIRVGDYVNGSEVVDINGNLFVNEHSFKTELQSIVIKSIVTKEQFLQMEYRLGD